MKSRVFLISVVAVLVLFSFGIVNNSTNAETDPYTTGDACLAHATIYNNAINSINQIIMNLYGNSVSQEVANTVIENSDTIGTANAAASFLVDKANGCGFDRINLYNINKYSPNILQSLELYKHTTPEVIPEFSTVAGLVIIISVIGVIALTRFRKII